MMVVVVGVSLYLYSLQSQIHSSDPIRCGCIDRNNCYVIRTLTPLAIPASIHTNVNPTQIVYIYITGILFVADLNSWLLLSIRQTAVLYC